MSGVSVGGTCRLSAYVGVKAAFSSWLNLVGSWFMSTNWYTVDLRASSDSFAQASKLPREQPPALDSRAEVSDLCGHAWCCSEDDELESWLLCVLGN